MANVLDNAADRGGLHGITMAAAYHQGRDIFPHNPARKVHFLEGDSVFFQPDARLYRGLALQPKVSALAQESDPLASLCPEASARSLHVRAWTVFLHNYTLGAGHPGCACRNAFGDAHLTDLCPSNPDVRAYVIALSADISGKGVAAVVAESLHFHSLEHGFHHERYFIELGLFGRFLLGLCFCDHCLEAARRRGVQAEKLRQETRRELERRFAADPMPEPPELVREMVGAFAGGEMAGYLETRAATVVSLVAEAAEAAAAEKASFAFIDLSGAANGARLRSGREPCRQAGHRARDGRRRGRLLSLRLHAPAVARPDPFRTRHIRLRAPNYPAGQRAGHPAARNDCFALDQHVRYP